MWRQGRPRQPTPTAHPEDPPSAAGAGGLRRRPAPLAGAGGRPQWRSGGRPRLPASLFRGLWIAFFSPSFPAGCFGGMLPQLRRLRPSHPRIPRISQVDPPLQMVSGCPHCLRCAIFKVSAKKSWSLGLSCPPGISSIFLWCVFVFMRFLKQKGQFTHRGVFLLPPSKLPDRSAPDVASHGFSERS